MPKNIEEFLPPRVLLSGGVPKNRRALKRGSLVSLNLTLTLTLP